jgi:hypothetical protein
MQCYQVAMRLLLKGRPIFGLIIKEILFLVNFAYSHLIKRPLERGQHERGRARFKSICCMPLIHGAIDCTHMHISKPAFFQRIIILSKLVDST